MTSVFSWQNSVNLCPASFWTPGPNLPVTPGISWLRAFAFQSPIMKRTCFFLVLVLEDLVGHHTAFNLSPFSIRVWGTDLDYCDTEWFALEMNRDRSVVFEISPKYCVLDSFDYDGYSISSKGFLPTAVDIMVIWIKFPWFQSILVYWFLKYWCLFLPSPVWPLPIYLDSWT